MFISARTANICKNRSRCYATLMILRAPSKLITLLALSAMLFLAIGGIFYCTNLMMVAGNAHAHRTADCAGAMDAPGCPIGLSEHLSAWNNLTRAMQSSTTAIIALFVGLAWLTLMAIPTGAGWPALARYLRAHQRFKLNDYLVQLFSRGILHPKVLA